MFSTDRFILILGDWLEPPYVHPPPPPPQLTYTNFILNLDRSKHEIRCEQQKNRDEPYNFDPL